MNFLKLTVAAATITVGLVASAAAAPIAPVSANGITGQVEQVRLVCNRRGNCWHTRSYGYGYGNGWRGHRNGWRGNRHRGW